MSAKKNNPEVQLSDDEILTQLSQADDIPAEQVDKPKYRGPTDQEIETIKSQWPNMPISMYQKYGVYAVVRGLDFMEVNESMKYVTNLYQENIKKGNKTSLEKLMANRIMMTAVIWPENFKHMLMSRQLPASMPGEIVNIAYRNSGKLTDDTQEGARVNPNYWPMPLERVIDEYEAFFDYSPMIIDEDSGEMKDNPQPRPNDVPSLSQLQSWYKTYGTGDSRIGIGVLRFNKKFYVVRGYTVKEADHVNEHLIKEYGRTIETSNPTDSYRELLKVTLLWPENVSNMFGSKGFPAYLDESLGFISDMFSGFGSQGEVIDL